MELITALVMSFGGLFVADNKEFFDVAEEQIKQGAEWHYVGKSPLDPNAKSIPAQMCDGTCDEPYILWKLKLPK
tara:strand:+ start:539 stop:760 length:222 start_codon:yes stop_codon:yes gene_type:complete